MVGKTFGRLTVASYAGTTSYHKRTWKCKCVCGNYTVVMTQDLTTGKTKSCGCLRKEESTRRAYRHGYSNTRTYRAYTGMLQRCENQNMPGYQHWGGRGIKVCSRWRQSFKKFLSDMGECPKGKSLDRYPDKHGDYKTSNCRWATSPQQNRNTRRNVLITYKGKTCCVAEWAENIGINVSTLYMRLKKYGWPVDKALNYGIKNV